MAAETYTVVIPQEIREWVEKTAAETGENTSHLIVMWALCQKREASDAL